jgi:hypothetical protein
MILLQNTFHWESLLKAHTHFQEHKSSMHDIVIQYILKFVQQKSKNIKANTNQKT